MYKPKKNQSSTDPAHDTFAKDTAVFFAMRWFLLPGRQSNDVSPAILGI